MRFQPHLLAAAFLIGCGMIPASAADVLYPVVSVPAPDRVVVMTRNFPVVLGLAHVSIPDDDATRAAAQAYLEKMLKGKKVSVMYADGFGTDEAGAAKVQLMVAKDNVNAELVEQGLARFQEGAKPLPAYERIVRTAEEKARKNKSGVWKQGDEPVVAAKPSRVAVQKKGPFVSELDTPYYFASDSAEAAKLNPQRVIYYPNEAAAKRAGKKIKAKVDTDAIASSGSEADADALFAKGQDAYNLAIDKGNTPERDKQYEVAYQYFTKAMQDYSALVEKDPKNEALGEKLRKCMQLRYGTIKQRRFH